MARSAENAAFASPRTGLADGEHARNVAIERHAAGLHLERREVRERTRLALGVLDRAGRGRDIDHDLFFGRLAAWLGGRAFGRKPLGQVVRLIDSTSMTRVSPRRRRRAPAHWSLH